MSAFDDLISPAPLHIGIAEVLPRSGNEILRALLRRERIASTARLVFLHWPAARTATEALAWHLTDRLPHPSGTSLLGMCVVKAFEIMACTQSALEDCEKLSDEVLVAYFAGLFEHVAVLPEIGVTGPRSGWDAIASGPLSAWLDRNRPAKIELLTEIPAAALAFSPAAYRLAVFERVIPPDLRRDLHAHVAQIIDPPY